MIKTLYFHQYRWLAAVIAVFVFLSACGQDRQQPAPEAMPTQSSASQDAPTALSASEEEENEKKNEEEEGPGQPAQESAATIPTIVDRNLLEIDHLQPVCDQSGSATITCLRDGNIETIATTTNASDFTRWRLSWGQSEEGGLNGSETLHVRLRSQGDLAPRLYLLDGTDRRISTPISFSKTTDGWQDLHMPLAEIQDDEGNLLDYADIRELEFVFEWADMDGEIEIEALQFKSIWSESMTLAEDSQRLADSLILPPDFVALAAVDGFSTMTQIQVIDTETALISQQNGRVWRLRDTNSDQIWDERTLYFSGLNEIVGLLHDPEDDSVWVGGRGQLYRLSDNDGNGVVDQAELRVNGLPWGRHQNNGLAWNPDPDPFTGEAGRTWIYFGLGSTEDLEIGGELNATVLRFPKDGQSQDDLEVVSFGNRNAYDVVWGQVEADGGEWHLFASENGPDFNDAPDEVNHIRWQHHYGFPVEFGVNFEQPATTVDNLPYAGSLYDVTPHASASGLAYVTNPEWPESYRGLYVSLFGQVFDEAIVGHTVEHIKLTPFETETGQTFRGEPITFIEGLERPLPMTTDEQGNLIVGDYATGVVYRVVYTP